MTHIIDTIADERDRLREEVRELKCRIREALSERNRWRGEAEMKRSLRDEFKALLGTEDIAEGVKAVKTLKANQCGEQVGWWAVHGGLAELNAKHHESWKPEPIFRRAK